MGHGVGGSFAAVTLATALLAGAATHARADGALAVGSTGDVVKDGIAFGMVANEPKDKAAEKALRHCRTFKARAAAERCRVVATFSGQCFAVAYDPQPGTPGAGWGIGPDQISANLKAIAMCEKTAGASRKGFCQVESGGCDTGSGAKTALKDTDKAAPPRAAAPAPAPDSESRWTELRKSLSEEQRSRSNWDIWDILVGLLVAGAVAWAAYVFSRPLRGGGKTGPASAKSSRAKGRAQRSPAPPKSAQTKASRTASSK